MLKNQWILGIDKVDTSRDQSSFSLQFVSLACILNDPQHIWQRIFTQSRNTLWHAMYSICLHISLPLSPTLVQTAFWCQAANGKTFIAINNNYKLKPASVWWRQWANELHNCWRLIKLNGQQKRLGSLENGHENGEVSEVVKVKITSFQGTFT